MQIEQDRQRAERNLADTEYLAREVVALRMAVTDFSDEVVTRDVLRAELKVLLEQLDARKQGRRHGRSPRHDDGCRRRRSAQPSGPSSIPSCAARSPSCGMLRDITVDGRRRLAWGSP